MTMLTWAGLNAGQRTDASKVLGIMGDCYVQGSTIDSGTVIRVIDRTELCQADLSVLLALARGAARKQHRNGHLKDRIEYDTVVHHILDKLGDRVGQTGLQT